MSPARAEATARATAPATAPRAPRPRPTVVPEATPKRGIGRIVHAGIAAGKGTNLGRVATLATVVLFASVFGIVIFQTLIVQGQARLDSLAAHTATEQQRAKDLHQQVADLESPTRITDAAKALGMIHPPSVGYLQSSAGDDANATYVAPAAPPVTTPKATKPATSGTSTTGKTSPTNTPTTKTTGTTTPASKTKTTTTTTAPKTTKTTPTTTKTGTR